MSEPNPAMPMEDILASIRRIIAEDPPLARPKPVAVPSSDEEDVLELGDATPEPSYGSPEEIGDAPAFEVPPVSAHPAAAAAPAESLISAQAAEASRKALSGIAGMRIDPQADQNTLDGLVRELLRPLLKDWLDAHLPELVERVVTREIARLGR